MLVATLTGCGTLIPKQVEFFQDKVEKFPEPNAAQKELQRQAAFAAKENAAATVKAAIVADAPAEVLVPAKATEILTDVVSTSVGTPSKTSKDTPEELSADLRHAIAKLSKKVDEFKEDNNQNIGHKIEGTGLIQVSYFAWIGGIAVLLLIGWYVIRTLLSAAAMSNPAAAIGVGALNVAGTVVGKGLQQVVHGGEVFKNWVQEKIDDPELQKKLLEAFRISHQSEQDGDVQAVIKQLTK